MNQDHRQDNYYEDEITLKELILKLKEFWVELWSNKILIILIAIPFVAFFVYKSLTSEIKYPANLTFMLNDEKGGGGGISSVLGQFGLGGLAGGGGAVNTLKMIELSKSRMIIKKLLSQKIDLEGKTDLIANHLIDVYGLHEGWAELENYDLGSFYFEDLIADNTSAESNKAILHLKSLITGGENTEGLFNITLDEESGILNIDYNTLNEELSIQMATLHFEILSEYFVDKTTEKQRISLDQIKNKRDSTFAELTTLENRLARLKDSSRGLYTTSAKLNELQLTRDVEMMNIIYGEIVKNYETSEYLLKTKTPVIQVIDYPISPIKPEKESLPKNVIIGLFLGGFLGSIFIIGRKILNDAMSADD